MQTSTHYGFNEPESTDFVDISDLSDNWDNADGIIHSLSADIAPDFDATESYAVGDYCIYQSTLYRCITAHIGAWDASHFEVTTVTAEIKASEFESLYGLITKTTTIGKDANDNTQITETDTTHGLTAVTTIVKTSSTVTTITCVITKGTDTWTKTTTITTTASGKTIAESYT